MITFIWLNWKFEKRLYSTEVVPLEKVLRLKSNLEGLINTYKTTYVRPVSDIFWEDSKDLDFPKILEFLDQSIKTCVVDGPTELGSFQKLLGADLRHGDPILDELIDITQSVIVGGGKYDHIRMIDSFLKAPGRGANVLEVRAITEARNALAGLKRDCTDNPPVRVKQVLEELGISTDDVPQETLDIELHLLQDDGMGYGATNGPCDCVELWEGKLRLWM